MKDTLIEGKNNLQGIISRVNEAKNQINDLEHKEEKDIQSGLQEEKRTQNIKDSVRSLWDYFKRTNTHFIGANV